MAVFGVEGDVLADAVHVRDDLVQVADRQAPLAEPLVPAGLGVGRAFEVAFLAGAGCLAGDAVVSWEPSTRPMPWTMASSAREAVILGSFWRS